MLELNIEFQEQYKRLDKLCKDMYSSGEGVSAYIREMEKAPYNERIIVYNWETIYKQLKHIRWMRNQLAHEISIDSDFCTQSDVDWVKHFCSDILSCNDPLAVAYRIKKKAQQENQSKPKPKQAIQLQQKTDTIKDKPPKRKSLLGRIVSAIKGWFS